MLYSEMFKIVKSLEFDKELEILKSGNQIISILRPSTLSKRFKNYDINKNFQIYLTEGKRKFRPNHLRLMIDLNLRVRSRPDLKEELLLIFDNIFYGKDPDEEIKKIENEKFGHYLNSLEVIANLAQLFIIEQDYCYHKESNFEPPTLFFQGWVREFIDSVKEIDNLCMSVCNFRPPSVKYTNKENAKHKKHDPNFQPLWYL
ncbi:MAG: hypothetical protein GX962_16560 [Epulopiscium sp.]|nr:hypothetical protein [Candidatus Epulonipiscium sp.]